MRCDGAFEGVCWDWWWCCGSTVLPRCNDDGSRREVAAAATPQCGKKPFKAVIRQVDLDRRWGLTDSTPNSDSLPKSYASHSCLAITCVLHDTVPPSIPQTLCSGAYPALPRISLRALHAIRWGNFSPGADDDERECFVARH